MLMYAVFSLLLFAQAQAQFEYKVERVIIDILNQTLPGQCPVPSICLEKKQSCGEETSDHHVVVNCTHRYVGPYMPGFLPYILPRRTWDFDFSYNDITTLDSLSFTYSQVMQMNLTRLVLAHNYIYSIHSDTFRENISKDLTYLDLSFNQLAKIEKGTFNDVPALRTLLLNNNLLLSVDSLCATPFPSLLELDVDFNRVSNLPLSCLSTSTQTVDLRLNYNYLGSIDDCSFSPKVDFQLEHNPVLCGCSEKATGQKCLVIDPTTQKSKASTQPSCTTDTCQNITYSVKSDWIDGMKGTYKVTVSLSGEGEHVVQVLQYRLLGNESVSAELVESKEGVIGEFTSGSLEVKNEYSVCVKSASDSENKQRKCSYIEKQSYQPSSAYRVAVPVYTFLIMLFVAYC